MAAFDASDIMTSMAGSLIVGIFLLFGPLDSFLINKFGCRTMCIIGGCITMVGFALSAAAKSMPIFMITYGIISGLGIGICSLAGVVMVNIYFFRRRGIAGGIVSSGAGFGMLVLAPIVQYLLQVYDWRGAMLIMSGIMFHFCACGALMKPLHLGYRKSDTKDKHNKAEELQIKCAKNSHNIIITTDEQRQPMLESNFERPEGSLHDNAMQEIDNNLDTSTRLKQTTKHFVTASNIHEHNLGSLNKTSSHPNHASSCAAETCEVASQKLLDNSQHGHSVSSLVNSENLENNRTNQRRIYQCLLQRTRTLCDLSLFCNSLYIPILLGGFFIQMGQFIPNTFLPKYCRTIGLQSKNVTDILALFGAMNIFGRLSGGILANVKCVSSLFLCNMSIFMCAVCCALFPLCVSYWSLCLFAIGFGYFIGFFPPLQPLILIEYFGIEQLASAIGFLQMFKGPAALIGPPLGGVVYEWTKDYAMSMEFAAVLFLLSVGVQCLIPIINRLVKNKAKISAQIEMMI